MKSIAATIITIAVLAWALPNVATDNYLSLIVAGVVLTFLEKIIEPILKLLFLPINIVTLGLFSTVINVFILWLATYFVPGFSIAPMIIFGVQLNHFFSLLVVSVAISLFQSFVKFIL